MAERANDRVLDFHDGVIGFDLRMLPRFASVQNRRARHVMRFEPLEPIFRRVGEQHFLG